MLRCTCAPLWPVFIVPSDELFVYKAATALAGFVCQYLVTRQGRLPVFPRLHVSAA